MDVAHAHGADACAMVGADMPRSLIILLSALLLSCATAPVLERAATLPAGEGRLAAGLQAHNLSSSMLPTAATVSYRRGLAERIDAALRITALGAGLSVRYQLLHRDALTLTVGVEGAGAFVPPELEDNGGPTEIFATMDGRLYAEYAINDSVAILLVPTLRMVRRTSLAYTDDGTMLPRTTDSVRMAGADLVIPVELETLTFFPTIGFGRAWGDIRRNGITGDLDQSNYVNFGIGLGF